MSAVVVYVMCVAGCGCGSRDSVKDTEVGVCSCLHEVCGWVWVLG